MSQDYKHEYVGPAFDILAEGLKPFVEQRFQTNFGDRWRTEMNQALRLRPNANHLDAHALLTLLIDTWREVFYGVLTPRERNYVGGLLDMRNRWAHQAPFSDDDTFRTLDDCERLLAAIGASQVADITRLKQRFKGISIEPPPNPPPIPACDDRNSVTAPKLGSKYRPLFDYLMSLTTGSITHTFTEIEHVLGCPLPPAARNFNPWWGNDGRGPAKAWMAAGWRTCRVNRASETVTFVRA